MKASGDRHGLFGTLMRPPWRTVVPASALLLMCLAVYLFWSPGAVVTDGRHDRGTNGIWLQHGWLGDDTWFDRNNKLDQRQDFLSMEAIRTLAQKLRTHHITDVYPHMAPTENDGQLPPIDHKQCERFLAGFDGFRVMPWIGGAWGVQAHPDDPDWRANFTESVRAILEEYPGFTGVHINIEPCPSGNRDFILLLREVRTVLPEGRLLSVAAYPPPTRWHPFPEVHWDKAYFREVASNADQVVVMMYDTSLRRPRYYESLMKQWTVQILDWVGSTDVLLGLPAYDDADTDYHDPQTENLQHALSGVHAGLFQYESPPDQYRGVAVYSEWEMQPNEWDYVAKHFLKQDDNDKPDR